MAYSVVSLYCFIIWSFPLLVDTPIVKLPFLCRLLSPIFPIYHKWPVCCMIRRHTYRVSDFYHDFLAALGKSSESAIYGLTKSAVSHITNIRIKFQISKFTA